MSTALDLDIAALVGDMPTEPCESSSHDPADRAHDDGPATHYARIHCPACEFNGIKAYCQQFTTFIQQCDERLYRLQCHCGYTDLAARMATILGPIGNLP